MAKLPIRPIIFVPAYLLVYVMVFLAVIGWGPIPWSVGALGILGGISLHIVWIFQSLTFLSQLPISYRENTRLVSLASRAHRFLPYGVIACAIAISYETLLEPQLVSWPTIELFLGGLIEIIGMVAVFLYFALFWIAARALCEAEDGPRSEYGKIFGTFLLFAYLAFTAPFIFRRLKKLDAKCSFGASTQSDSGAVVP